MPAFLSFIVLKLRPNKDRLEDFLRQLCAEHGVDPEAFNEEDKKKVVLYLKMFIDVVEDE